MCQVVGVVGDTEELVVTLEVGGVNGDVGLPQDDRTGVFQALDHVGVFCRDVVFQRGCTGGTGHAGNLPSVFQGEWQPMQSAQCLTLCLYLIGLPGFLPGFLFIERHHGIDGVIALATSVQEGLSDVHTG